MSCLLDLLQRFLRHSGVGGSTEIESTMLEVCRHVYGVVGEVEMQVTTEAILTARAPADMATFRENSALEFRSVTPYELAWGVSRQKQQNQDLQIRFVRESQRKEGIEELDRVEWERLQRAP